MPGKKSHNKDEKSDESPTKKIKASDSTIVSELTAARLDCSDSILEFKQSKLGDGFKSRVRSLIGDAGTLLRECKERDGNAINWNLIVLRVL